MKKEWAYVMGMRCIENGVPFFFKQMGGPGGKDKGDGVLYKEDGTSFERQFPQGCDIHNSQQEVLF